MMSHPAFSSVSMKNMMADSVSKVTMTGSIVGNVVDENNNAYILAPGGKIAATLLELQSPEVIVDSTLLAKAQTLTSPNTLLRSSKGSIYFIGQSKKHAIPSWADFTVIQPSLTSTQLYDETIANIRESTVPAIAPASMIKSSTSSRVYITDGISSQIRYVPSVEIMQALGLISTRTVTQTTIDSYPLNQAALSDRIKCGSAYYVGSKGVLKLIGAAQLTQYGLVDGDFVAPASETCDRFVKSGQLGSFIRTDNGIIYSVSGGKKSQIYSYQAYVSMGGAPNNTTSVTYSFAQRIPSL